MLVAIELLKERSPAHQSITGGIVVAWHLSGQISIGESHSKLVGLFEACTDDLDRGVAFAGSTLWIDFVNADWSIEESGLTIGEYISEDSVVCVLLDHLWSCYELGPLMANVALTPGVWSSKEVNGVSGILAASNLDHIGQIGTVVALGNPLGLPLTLG
jgi:hypothetical protein